MSLLTKEHQDEIDRARKVRKIIQDSTKCQSDFTPRDANDLYEISGVLLRIIDDLQARSPKQYTEQELLAMCKANSTPEQMEIGAFVFWCKCARFVGALKAEP